MNRSFDIQCVFDENGPDAAEIAEMYFLNFLRGALTVRDEF